MSHSSLYLDVVWPAPSHIRALTTLRTGGFSLRDYQSLNVASHVGDEEKAVLANRQILKDKAGLPTEPYWLKQVHGVRVIEAKSFALNPPPEADASVAFAPGQVCAVMTADCLPLLITDKGGSRVAAIHAGWRGLAAGIIENTVQSLIARPGDLPEDLLVWLGPAIGPKQFEVGPEVYNIFVDADPDASFAFQAKAEQGRWLADIYHLASLRLKKLGITQIYGGDYCTYSDSKRFYSYRRDKTTGRMASMIWIDKGL